MMQSALNDAAGKPVDWWFIYKLPRGIGPGTKTTGDEFLYCDSGWDSELRLSKNRLNDSNNALARTLQQLFSEDSDSGYVLWNDEIPPTKGHPKPANNHLKGHSKGVLAFNKKTNCGFYLLHSTPRYPAEGVVELPDDEREYGQTFCCVTVNFATAMAIAEVIHTYHEPQVYASRGILDDTTSPAYLLANHEHRSEHQIRSWMMDFKFRSRDRNDFRLFSKHRKWSEPVNGQLTGRDFWSHLVGPALHDNMDVETWRRGKVFGNVDPLTQNVTFDVLGVNLESIGYHGYRWPFTKDHAKWGSTEHRPAGFLIHHPGFVVIADINRDESQAKRSGGGLAFQHDGIWRALKSIETIDSAKSHESSKLTRIAH